MSTTVNNQVENEVNRDTIVDHIFGELNLDQLKSKIDELSYFTDVIDEKISNKYFYNAKSISELWMSVVDIHSLGFEMNSPQFQTMCDKLAEYLKTLYEHDFCNFMLALSWFSKQTINISDKTLSGKMIIAHMILSNRVSMNMMHSINDITNNLILNKFNKFDARISAFASDSFKISYFIFNLIANKYMEK